MIHNERNQHDIVEKGLTLFQSIVDPKLVTNPDDEKINKEELRKTHDKIITERLQAVNQLNHLKSSGSCNYNDIYSVLPLYQNEAKNIIEENNWLINDE